VISFAQVRPSQLLRLAQPAVTPSWKQASNATMATRQDATTASPSPSYTCYGNPGSSSLCMKYPVCGDSIIDQGEQCDNGNRVGCTLNCVPDTGYKCSAVLGTASLCGLCGNGIVEPGEECDNKGLAGCSTGCKVDAGFICQGTSSFCYRKNPVCGNGVIEVAESCDDGNQVNGDGCS
jgi:cysteine-rich repeat protein